MICKYHDDYSKRLQVITLYYIVVIINDIKFNIETSSSLIQNSLTAFSYDREIQVFEK